jgi:hypothetical protein
MVIDPIAPPSRSTDVSSAILRNRTILHFDDLNPPQNHRIGAKKTHVWPRDVGAKRGLE